VWRRLCDFYRTAAGSEGFRPPQENLVRTGLSRLRQPSHPGIRARSLGHRDLIDVFAASRRWTNAELEEFGRRHARGRFEREDLQANLTGAEWTDDAAFAAYGLDDTAITALRSWAMEWADDLAARLLQAADDPGID
jgi:hypothetical protein